MKEAQKCYCDAEKCRKWIGGEPDLESNNDRESEDVDSSQNKKKNGKFYNIIYFSIPIFKKQGEKSNQCVLNKQIYLIVYA